MINGGDSESFLIRTCLHAIFYNPNNMTHNYDVELHCFRHLLAICTKFILIMNPYKTKETILVSMDNNEYSIRSKNFDINRF